jgi:hypothetical protein
MYTVLFDFTESYWCSQDQILLVLKDLKGRWCYHKNSESCWASEHVFISHSG